MIVYGNCTSPATTSPTLGCISYASLLAADYLQLMCSYYIVLLIEIRSTLPMNEMATG